MIQDIKKTVPILLLSLLSLYILERPLQASTQEIYMGLGQVTFDENFMDTTSFQLGISLIANSGLTYSLSMNYLETSTTSGTGTLKIVPIEISGLYYHKKQAKISPYIGGGINLNYLSSPYDNFGIGYHVRGGWRYKAGNDSSVFLDIKRQYYTDSYTNLKIEPLLISLGITMHINQRNKRTKERVSKPKKQKTPSRNTRRLRGRRR